MPCISSQIVQKNLDTATTIKKSNTMQRRVLTHFYVQNILLFFVTVLTTFCIWINAKCTFVKRESLIFLIKGDTTIIYNLHYSIIKMTYNKQNIYALDQVLPFPQVIWQQVIP